MLVFEFSLRQSSFFGKSASVRVLDLLVPIMAGIYIILTLFLIIVNFRQFPGVFARVFEEALGLRQAIAGGFGAVLMNGVKRGLFLRMKQEAVPPRVRQRRQKPPILPKSD